MQKFLRRVLLSDHGAPPQPNEAELPAFPNEAVMEVIYAKGRMKRAFNIRDGKGFYRIYLERWDTSDWEAGYGARWTGGYGGSLTDSLERARELAIEVLAGS
jgi:hypothetical protein